MALSALNCQRLSLLSKNLLRPSIIPLISRNKSHESKKWPGYYVVYNLENISTINSVNRLKYRTTIVSGAIIPLVQVMEIASILPIEVTNTLTLTFGAITVFLHLVGYFCNNVIGIIYSKQDTDEIKIAYVNYWGKRIDIDTTYNDIERVEPKSKVRDGIFNHLLIKSQNKRLRLFIEGKVIDSKKFYRLIGADF